MLNRVRGLVSSRRLVIAAGAAILLFPLAIIGTGSAVRTAASTWATNRPAHSLAAFRSDKELAAFLRDIRKREQRRPQAMYDMASAPPPPAVMAAPVAGLEPAAAQPRTPGITNNQE